MENITIQVDPEIAQAYREAEPEKQQNALLVFNLILKELFKDASVEETVQQIRQETEKNGLTPEILESILNLPKLYQEFADEDRQLAEDGINEYADLLTQEDKL